MRKTLSSFVMSAVALALFVPAVSNADDTEVQKALQEQYSGLAQAAEKGDTAAWEKVAGTSFKHVTLLGKEQTKDQWLEDQKKFLGGLKSQKVTITINAMGVKGDEATVITKTAITGEGPDAEGNMVPLDLKLTARTVWAKEGSGWKIKLDKEGMIEGKRNGKMIKFPGTPEAEEARKSLQPMYDAVAELYGKQDWETLAKLFSPGLAVADKEGATLSKQELIERVKAGAKNLLNPIMFLNIQQVSVENGTAKVVRVMKVLADINLPGGKKRAKYVAVARDTYTKAEKGWNHKVSEELHSESYLDDQLVPLSSIGGK